MNTPHDLSQSALEFRRHFDQYFLGVIPRLLNQEGLFLSFLSALVAIDSLSGAYQPDKGTGERFRAFIMDFFPKEYAPHASLLWKFRNHMIHSLNPRPFMIVCHNSRMHLCEASGVRMLNAEDFYADLVSASRAYFAALYADADLQSRFIQRIAASDGGKPTTASIVETIHL
jgi:hypothetical protein